MRKRRAAIGTTVFFILAPGTVVGLIPWLLTGWQMREPTAYWAPLLPGWASGRFRALARV